MKYTVSFENNTTATIYADSMREAELQAYCAYGKDAIGLGISGENKDFMMTCCVRAWEDYTLSKPQFKNFTLDDVFYHLVAVAYAWVNFPTETGEEWDYEDGCKYKYERIGKEGKEYLKKHDRLGNYMESIGWDRW